MKASFFYPAGQGITHRWLTEDYGPNREQDDPHGILLKDVIHKYHTGSEFDRIHRELCTC